MSRCFPFPPPGYEKKTWTDDLEPLKKEKEKEKKRKKEKEKKDKDKRDRKEKRDKDKAEEKHRDKKHKKEKHRDKKDKDKDKDRSTNSDEKKLSGISQDQNGDGRSYDEKLLAKPNFQFGEKPSQKEKERDTKKISISGDKKPIGQLASLNGGRVNKNINSVGDSQNSKFVEELGRRIRDEGGGVGPQLAEKFVADPKRDSVLRCNNSMLAGHREDNKRNDSLRSDEQGLRDESKIRGNVLIQNHHVTVQGQVVQMPRPVENDIKRSLEVKDKAVDRVDNVKALNKVKEKDGEWKGPEKVDYTDKWREKEKSKVEGEQRKGVENVREQKKTVPMGVVNLKTSKSPVEGNQINEGNSRKRKDTDRNGFLHDDFVKSNKLPKPVSSSQTLSDSGTTSETSHGSLPPKVEKLGAVNSHKVDTKERKPNGIIVPASSAKPSSAIAQGGQLREAAPKPSHPDIKYLSQVLSVPTMEDWSEFDDQEWLFGSSKSETKNSKLGSPKLETTTQVWSEALRLEEADVYALPYVIPY